MEMIVPDNVEELKRNKLQSLCKTFKIPANLKNVELIRRLKELRQYQLSNQVMSNENDAQSDTAVVTSSITGDGRSVNDEDQMLCDNTNAVDDVILHHDNDVTMATGDDDDDDDENIDDTKKKGTSNRRRKRVGHSRRQRRGRKAKVTTTNTNDDVVMNEDHVINQCPEATNTSNHGDGHTGNPPPAVFTPAKEIINEDNVISSSARRRRKCWSEIEHNESIEELFDRMTSSSAANTAVPVVDMEINNNDDDDDDDEVKRVEDEEQNLCNDERSVVNDDTQEDDQPPRKRRRRSTFDLQSSTVPASSVVDDDNSSTVHDDNTTPSSNRSSLSNQFMKQQKQKSVAVGNSSLFTEQSLSPLVTNSQSAPSGATVDDDDKVKEQVTAMLEDRVKLRKSQCTEGNAKERGGATIVRKSQCTEGNAKERGGATTAGQRRKATHSVTTTQNSKIPVAKSAAKRTMTAKDFDRIHQRNFNKSQSIVEYNNRRQHLASVTPLSNSASINNNNVKCTTDGYQFKVTKPQLNQTVSSSEVFKFNAASSSSNKRHREKTALERRKSYNAQSAKKKAPKYKPYTGKLPPVAPIKIY